jgi:hypothetical protein
MNRHNLPGSVSFVSPIEGVSPREESRYDYWLARLKSRKALALPAELQNESANSSTDKTDKTGSADLETEVAWRVAAMRPQIPPRGAIPFLLARLDLATPCAPGCCGSCGDPLDEGRRYRCAPCQEAAWLALNQVREDVPAQVTQ